jgi:hypothetical protein
MGPDNKVHEVDEVVDTGAPIVLPDNETVLHVEDRPNGSRIVISLPEE